MAKSCYRVVLAAGLEHITVPRMLDKASYKVIFFGPCNMLWFCALLLLVQ